MPGEIATSSPPRRPSILRDYALVGAMVLLISLMHYNTAMHIHEAHGIYRRLYYFPIIIAAFRGGLRASLVTALVIIVAYAPHAFGAIGFDPAPTLEKVLEMVLYIAVATVSGVLVDRERALRADLEATASDLRRALDEKSAMERELIRRERLAAVGQLSAGLAHEIRNPLASIKGSAEVLADDFPADHPKGRLVQIVKEESERLNDVLTRFLSFARSEGGGTSTFDLGEEMSAVADLLTHRPGAPRVAVAVPPAGELMIRADREGIRQLLLNLALNAAAAAGPAGAVGLSVAREGRTAVCLVEDDGPGFSPEALEKFGTPFFSTRPEGTGLGLATCLRIATDHGGSVDAEPDHPAGALVRVRLPLGPAEVEAD